MKNILAAFLMLAVLTTSSSMFVLAATPDKQALVGELIVSGSEEAVVMVDGERAVSGRTVLSTSVVTTPANAGATISFGNAGRIDIAPNSTVNLNTAEKSIAATLTAGKVKVFNNAGVEAKIITSDEIVTADANQSNLFAVNFESGATTASTESGMAFLKNGAQTGQQDNTGNSGPLNGALVPVLIFAGVVTTAAIFVLTKDDDELPATISGVR